MKKVLTLTLVLGMTSAFAQTERDFGGLLPDGQFTITNKKTDLKEDAEVRYWDRHTTPSLDEFTYKVDGVRAPKKGIFGKRRQHKVTVNRKDGKVSRVSELSWTDSNNKLGVESISTSAISPEGHVTSSTTCFQNFKFGLFGTKSKKEPIECVTINEQVCKYLEDNKIDSTLVNDLNKCSETIGQLAKHQASFKKLASKDANRNIDVLEKLEKKMKNLQNFYDIPTDSLNNMASIVWRYGSALSHCEYLKENGWFKPAEEPATIGGSTDGEIGGATGGTEQ